MTMQAIRVGIIGVSGYTGAELARLLGGHPRACLAAATSRQYAGRKLGDIWPHLRACDGLVIEDASPEELAAKTDLVFCAVPHGSAMDVVPRLLAAGVRVVDLSADFRLRDRTMYETWYGPHRAAEFLPEAVYGLPELYRAEIATARLVANPGCYPTSVVLALAPLLKAGAIDPATIVIDAKSGVSGAGRSAKVASLFCEVTEGFRAYNIGVHRHTPEIEQELGRACGRPLAVSFSPHLLPMSRGILSTMYASVRPGLSEAEVENVFAQAFAAEPFVRFRGLGTLPATQEVRGSNFCHIGGVLDRRTGRLVMVSVIDNLVKGAAGQALQNMNLMCGMAETLGLDAAGVFP